MSGQIPEDFIVDLRHRVDIVEVIRDYVPLKKQGQNYSGICPFHAEKTPSFVVSPHKQIYRCFGCGKGGNVFSFLMEKNAISFPDAIAELAKRYGIPLPSTAFSPERDRQDSLRKRYHHINEMTAHFYQEMLNNQYGQLALSYLNKRELEEDTRQKFMLGYATSEWDLLSNFLLDKGVSEQEMLTLGIAIKSQKGNLVDRFRNRVMFPISDEAGRIIGFGGRVLDNSQPKYLNSPDTPLFNKGRHLYGLNLARGNVRSKDQAIIMEGYMDVITAHQHGVSNAVGALGTALTSEQAKVLMRFTYNTAICFDSDNAGQEAALRGMEVLQQLGCQVTIVTVPAGKDPDEYIKLSGADDFTDLVRKSPGLLEYKLQKLMEKYDASTMQGRVQIIRILVPDIQQIQSPVVRQAFIQIISDKLGIPEPTIHAELRKVSRTLSATYQEESRPVSFSPAVLAPDKAERNILRSALENPKLLEEIEEKGGRDLFSSQILKEIYQSYYLLRQAGHNIKANDLITLIDNPIAQQVLPELLLEEEEQQEDADRVFRDSLTNLVLEGLNKVINEKSSLMSKLEKAGDISSSVEIMGQIQQMVKEKQRLAATLRKGGNDK